MISTNELQQIKSLIHANHRFILTTHVNPDGDGIGSEIALATYLRNLGKEALILNHSETPDNCEFLDPLGDIQLYRPERHEQSVRESDVVFILDISDWKRLRDLGELLRTLPLPKVCIDHHPVNQPFADLDVIHPPASSTGELIYGLLTHLGASLRGRIAEALYTAVMTDTGSFRYSNTSPEAHRVAAELLVAGANPHQIYQNVYENQSPQKMRLLAYILNNLKYEKDGRLVWFVVNQETMKATNTTPLDTEGFADFPRTIRGVEICIMFLETKDGKAKISFRSKGRIVINGLANQLGGGGHPFAAGALVDGALKNVIPQVIEEAKSLF